VPTRVTIEVSDSIFENCYFGVRMLPAAANNLTQLTILLSGSTFLQTLGITPPIAIQPNSMTVASAVATRRYALAIVDLAYVLPNNNHVTPAPQNVTVDIAGCNFTSELPARTHAVGLAFYTSNGASASGTEGLSLTTNTKNSFQSMIVATGEDSGVVAEGNSSRHAWVRITNCSFVAQQSQFPYSADATCVDVYPALTIEGVGNTFVIDNSTCTARSGSRTPDPVTTARFLMTPALSVTDGGELALRFNVATLRAENIGVGDVGSAKFWEAGTVDVKSCGAIFFSDPCARTAQGIGHGRQGLALAHHAL
jgi:hypothetical protein